MVRELAGVQEGETVLVVTDTYSIKYGHALFTAANEVTKDVSLAVMTVYGDRRRHGQRAPEPIHKGMQHADVVFMPTEWSLFHSESRYAANEAGARTCSLAQPDDEIFARTIADSPFEECIDLLQKVNEYLIKAKDCHVTAPGGTDLYMSFEGKTVVEKNNIYVRKDGQLNASPPCVEANMAPVKGSAEGKLVIDADQASIGLINEPIECIIEKGKIVDIRGGVEAKKLKSYFDNSGEPLLYWVCELGIGLNPECRVRGRFVEDEAAYGTAHIGCGDNSRSWGKDGEIVAQAHTDSIFWKPTITLDGEKLMEDGKLVIPGVPENFKGYYE